MWGTREQNMPFGYVCSDVFITTSNTYEFDNLHPPPAPGPAILDNDETERLVSFFDDVITDHVDLSNEFFHNSNSESFEGLDTWVDRLPPQFHGTTTLAQPAFRDATTQYLNFGTDTNFTNGVFIPPPDQRSVEQVTRTMLNEIECLNPQPSAASTVPSSPSFSRHRQHSDTGSLGVQRPVPHGHGPSNAEEREGGLSQTQTRVTKRQRAKMMDGSGPPPRAKRRKASPKTAPGEKKRNLTEEEKRNNHIESEQKRRDQISESFVAMVRLVPELRNSRHSKSERLRLACAWLESMVADNEKLGALLASAERETGDPLLHGKLMMYS